MRYDSRRARSYDVLTRGFFMSALIDEGWHGERHRF